MKWISLLVILFGTHAWAFPELTRFQYNNCSACHVSPSGGGLLTSYGRSLSSEVLSTWGTEKEAGFLHGAVDRETLEQWILVGGDVRGVQVHKENAAVKTGRFIKMQADMSVGFVRDQGALVLTFGQLEDEVWYPYGTSYYGMWKPQDELSLRAGRFVPQFGVYGLEHIAFARSFTGLGLGATRNVAEVQWTGEQWTSNVSVAKQVDVDDPETSYILQAQYFFADRYKVAMNYWRGQSDGFDRDLYGTWMILGFSPRLYWVNELDWQDKKNSSTTTHSFVTYNKLGYTLFKGFDALIVGEYQKGDVSDTSTEVNRYGVGFQFYPRPHFEFTGTWTKQNSLALAGQEADYAWFILHYYL